MDRLDAEVGVEERVAPPRFGAAHGLGTYLFVFIAQWSAWYLVMDFITSAGAMMRDGLPNEAKLTAIAIPPTLFLGVASAVFFSVVSMRVFAWHLVRDRTPAGFGLFAPPLRSVLFWSAIGVLLAAAYFAAVQTIPAASEVGAFSKLAHQTASGRFASMAAQLLWPFASTLLIEGLVLRGVINSWGVKAASVVVVALYVAGAVADTPANWPLAIMAFCSSVAALTARLRTGSLVAAFAVHEAYVVAFLIAYYTLR